MSNEQQTSNSAVYEVQEGMDRDLNKQFRVTDTRTDSRVATCYVQSNADLVCAALNAYTADEPSPRQDIARKLEEIRERAQFRGWADIGTSAVEDREFLLSYIYRLENQERPAEPPSAWRPIETAPTLGKWVLLWWPDVTDAAFVGYCVDGQWRAATSGDRWPTLPGPTHWMPLPEGPSVTKDAPPPPPQPPPKRLIGEYAPGFRPRDADEPPPQTSNQSALMGWMQTAQEDVRRGRIPPFSVVKQMLDEIERLDADCALLEAERDMFKQQRADWKAAYEQAISKRATDEPPPQASNSLVSIHDAAAAGKKLREQHAASGAAWSFEDWLTIRYEELRRRFERACARITELESAADEPKATDEGVADARRWIAYLESEPQHEPDISIARVLRDLVQFYEWALPQITNRTAEPPADARWKFIQDESLHLVPFAMPTGAGDADIGWRVLQSHMGKGDVVIAEVYRDRPAEAIDAARAALTKSEQYIPGAVCGRMDCEKPVPVGNAFCDEHENPKRAAHETKGGQS